MLIRLICINIFYLLPDNWTEEDNSRYPSTLYCERTDFNVINDAIKLLLPAASKCHTSACATGADRWFWRWKRCLREKFLPTVRWVGVSDWILPIQRIDWLLVLTSGRTFCGWVYSVWPQRSEPKRWLIIFWIAYFFKEPNGCEWASLQLEELNATEKRSDLISQSLFCRREQKLKNEKKLN